MSVQQGSSQVEDSDIFSERYIFCLLFKLAYLFKIYQFDYFMQTNGLDERFNQTLQNSLRKHINEKQDDWDQVLDAILFAYRTSQHSSTKMSPFVLMYNRQPKLPIHLIVPTSSDDGAKSSDGVTNGMQRHDGKFQETFDHMVELRNQIKQIAQTNIVNAQKRQKKNYDKRNECQVRQTWTFHCCMF